MNKKVLGVFILVSLIVFVSAVQKEMTFPGTTVTGEFVQENFQFEKGWNLVHGILNPDWIQANDDNIKAIYAFNPTTSEYVRFYPEPENNKIGETSFAWGTWSSFGAVWIYSEKDFNSNYWKYEDVSLDKTLLFASWNFIAITSEMMGKTLNEIKGDCEFEGKGYFWDAELQKWDVEENILSASFDESILAKGILIKVLDYCTLETSTEDITSPPTIPSSASEDSIPIESIDTCIDSDGGENYYVKGKTSWGVSRIVDSCIDGKLDEGFCHDNEIGGSVLINCPNECQEGVCI
jgi:hypothetical protein